MKRWWWFAAAAALAGCIYEGREGGLRLEFPDDATDAGARLAPLADWDGGRPGDAGTGDAPGDAAPDTDGATDAAAWPTPELVATGDAYQLTVRGDALSVYLSVIVGGSLDTQLQLRQAGVSRVLESGVQILARNRLILDDDSVAASHRSGVFLHPRVAGPRADVAFGTVPQGVQLAGLTPTHVYYLRYSPVPGGFDEIHRRSRTDSSDQLVGCSIGTSAFDVAADGFAVLGRSTGTFAVSLAPLASGGCTAQTTGTKLSAAADPVTLLVGQKRVVIGTDVAVTTALAAVPRAGGSVESIGASAIGLWGGEPARPLAELDDTLFYVDDTGSENYLVERPAGKSARRLLPVGYRKVRAVGANATHVYYSTPEGLLRVPR